VRRKIVQAARVIRSAREPLEALRAALRRVGREPTPAGAVHAAVDELAARPDHALARVWVLEPGPRPTLRLAASAGRPLHAAPDAWSRVDGSFRSFRLGAGKIGRVAASGEAIAIEDVQRRERLLARPGWARREAIHGFAAFPLLHGGTLHGVLAVFSRAQLGDAEAAWIGAVADHLALAVDHVGELAELRLGLEAAAREGERLRRELAQERTRAAVHAWAPPGRCLSEAALRERERANLEAALAQARGRIYGRGGAAELLGLRPTTLASRLKKLGLNQPR
jgi:transcriptional regulator with GAF, ATPase, and Fis domain